jgi:Xaa-Pro aminopeptidase
MKVPGIETARVAKNLTFSVAEYQGETRLLRPNMTFHIPSIVKILGVADAGTSETVRVTETGCEVLTRFDRRLFVCPDGG